jgi:hypothetical protein
MPRAFGLVDLRFQRGPHVPRLDTNYRQTSFGDSAVKPLRQRPGFQSNPLDVVGAARQHCQQRFRFARDLGFSNDPARVIHNADVRLLGRNV